MAALAGARHPPRPAEPYQNNIFILPTRRWLDSGAHLAGLLIASINFQLNLGYLVTFLLLAAAAASVGVAHRNLHGLQIQLGACPRSLPEQTLDIPIQLKKLKKKSTLRRCNKVFRAKRQ